MDIQNLVGINDKIANVRKITLPYQLVIDKSSGNSEKNRVIFFGNDAGSLKPMITGKFSDYITLTNQCLDFVRRECRGLDLYYKSHPANHDERDLLNLEGYKIINEDEGETSEIFLWKNWSKIKYVFAVGSWSASSAAAMGISSYIFTELFRPIFGENLAMVYDDYSFELPEAMRIKDLSLGLPQLVEVLENKHRFYLEVKNLLENHAGDIWVSVSNTEFFVALVILVKVIKRVDSKRKVHLLLTKHHRWDVVKKDSLESLFDDIIFMPRVLYSFRFNKLPTIARLLRRIKNLPVKSEDIIFSFSQVDFLENCLVSTFNKTIRVGFIMARDFRMHYDAGNATFAMHKDFRATPSTWLFNHVLEPILGLQRTIFAFYGRRVGFFIMRYYHPINEIFDRVYVINLFEQLDT